MRQTHSLAAIACAAWMAATAPIALAGDGHDHGDAPAASSGPALSRFAAVSETFELVGVVNGKRLTLYLDRYADGSPVKGAKLELELGGVKVPVEPHGEGEFEAMLTQELKPGSLAVSAMVVAGAESDLLAGELDVHDEGPADKAAHAHGWREYATWAGAAAAVLVALLILARRLRATRNVRLGGAA